MAEEYTGVKYAIPEGSLVRQTIFTVENKHLIREMKKVGRDLADRGISAGKTGNFSVRYKSGFIITATSTNLAELTDEDFVVVEGFDFKGMKLVKAYGLREPSSETPMHNLIYSKMPDVRAIIHIHDPVLTKEKVIKKLKIKASDEGSSYGTQETAEQALGLLKENNFVVLREHGVVVVGKKFADCAAELITYHHRGTKVK